MHHIRCATFVALSILVLVQPDQIGIQYNLYAQMLIEKEGSDSKEVRRGSFTIAFTERSPLSAIPVFVERFWTEEKRIITGGKYNISEETFEVYVPSEYQHGTPYGLFVFISPGSSGTVPSAYKPILDKHRLIWIGANNAGNPREPWNRYGLAIDAVHNVKNRYTIDPQRVYAGGFSGGGRCTSVVTIVFPEVFQGGFYICGCNYFKKLRVPSRPNFSYANVFKTPPQNTLQFVKKRNRYVFFTGEADYNRDQTLVTYEQYRTDGFLHATYIEAPGFGHQMPNAQWFEEGIAFLDTPSVAVSTDSYPVPRTITDGVHNHRGGSLAEAKTQKTTSLSPGTELRLDARQAKKPFLVYVPSDYTPEYAWPVIFCYHGYRRQPTTWPFKQATGGREFIIIGMNYATEAYHRRFSLERIGPEKIFFVEALAIVSSYLNVDPKMVFMGGFSHGGYATSILGEQLLDKLAGLIILGAGRYAADKFPPSLELLQSKPIFIGIGSHDTPNMPRAEKAIRVYKNWGADVTFEEWKGVAHTFDSAKSTKLLQWLRANGPLKHLPFKLAEAQEAERTGKLGIALKLYHYLSKNSPTDEVRQKAAKAVENIERQAVAQLVEAEGVIKNNPYPEVAKRLNQIAKTYAGTIFADRAQQHLKNLLNTKADELEARARAAQKNRNYTKALQLYKLYLTHFAESDRYPQVKAHYNALKAKH